LWSKQAALFVQSLSPAFPVPWGCDREELNAQLSIAESAGDNPGNASLHRMAEITGAGYRRPMAPELLRIFEGAGAIRDHTVNDTSLAENIRVTLAIENDRLRPDENQEAQVRRESLMKQLFLLHYRKYVSAGADTKVMLRFGRNHLHRGYDQRGISRLGNFISGFAFSQHPSAFNLAAFGAGSRAALAGETWDADERGDALAFEFLAALARYPATVFDLRPLRPVLHRTPPENRSALKERLVYWADSYDAILCYKNVTPLPR
jgi:hypothetical protein